MAYGGVVAFPFRALGWIFHETLIEAILMASSYRMDIPCPNVSSRSWDVVSVRSTGQANTAPLKGEQKIPGCCVKSRSAMNTWFPPS